MNTQSTGNEITNTTTDPAQARAPDQKNGGAGAEEDTEGTNELRPGGTDAPRPGGTDAPRLGGTEEGSREPGPGADRWLSRGTPSAPLLGYLPVVRWVPMDIHSMMDYGGGLAAGSGALATDCVEARIASAVLGGANILVSSLTDYRLSVAKVIPIEAHEAVDYVWGAAAIAAPFVFGYWKKAPRVALSHVIAGASNILVSLVTDYRAYRGRGQQRRAGAASAG